MVVVVDDVRRKDYLDIYFEVGVSTKGVSKGGSFRWFVFGKNALESFGQNVRAKRL